MAQLTLDVGLRNSECRLLRKSDLDYRNLLVKVAGKGRKERLAPMSPEGRALIQRYISKHTNPDHEFIFATKSGRPISQRNSLRDLQVLLRKAKVIERNKASFKTLRPSCSHPAPSKRSKPIGWHVFRHTYGYTYIKNGGNVVKLQANMGHSAVTTTMIYVKLQTKDRVENHGAYSALVASARA
jgi:integrase/recombinase XerC